MRTWSRTSSRTEVRTFDRTESGGLPPAVPDPYFEYTIDENLCIGCAKCIEGCRLFGNGSFHLQVRHDRCVNCNECRIGKACPGDAFYRAPASDPYFHFTT